MLGKYQSQDMKQQVLAETGHACSQQRGQLLEYFPTGTKNPAAFVRALDCSHPSLY